MTDVVLMRVKPGEPGRSPRRRWHAAGTVLPMTPVEAAEARASGRWEEIGSPGAGLPREDVPDGEAEAVDTAAGD